jgi:hypothetical protein
MSEAPRRSASTSRTFTRRTTGSVFAHPRQRCEIDLLVVFKNFNILRRGCVEVDSVERHEIRVRDAAVPSFARAFIDHLIRKRRKLDLFPEP